MKICLITNDFEMTGLGGRNIALCRIMKGLIKNNDIEFHVFTGIKGKGKKPEKGIVVYNSGPNYKTIIKNILKIHKKEDFDIIHGYGLYPEGSLAVRISKIIRKPSIVSIIGSTSLIAVLKDRYILNWISRNADYITSETRHIANIFTKITKRKTKIIYISLEPFKIPTKKIKKGFIVGNVSYLGDSRKIKGWIYLLKAFAKFCRDKSDVRLVLIGSNNTEKESKINLFLKENKLEDRVCIKKLLEHKKTLEEISMFDVYVIPSLFEGIPHSLLEAMLLGKPIIATSVGGIPEVIRNGYNGILVKSFSAEEIYNNLEFLYRNPKERERLAKNAVQTLTKFKFRNEIIKWKKLYETAVRGV